MQGLICCLVFLSLALPAIAEDAAPALLWAREYFPDRIAVFNHVIETFDGGLAVAAAVPGTNGNNRPVIRFDSDGNMLWYAGNAFYAQSAFWVEELPDDDLISTGGAVLAPGDDVDLYLFRIDPSGQLVWAKTYAGSSEDDRGLCCTLLPDGGFAVCGYANDYDAWLLRTDSQGDTLWTRVWEPGWARARRVVYHDNGLVMFVDGGQGYGPLLIRYDLDGNLEWVSDFTGEFLTGVEWAGSLCTSSTGFTFVTGPWSWICHTDWSGEEQWSQEIVGTSGRMGYSISPTMDGGYVFSGKGGYWGPPFTVDIHSAPADTGTTYDGWLVKMDSLGSDEWHVFNSIGARANYFNCVQQLSQGGYIVVGQIQNTPYSSNWNGYLLRYAPETGIESGDATEPGLALLPSSNPFGSSVTITCSGPFLPCQLMVYDITGRLVRSLSDREGSSFLWDGQDGSGSEVPTGTYIIQSAIDGWVSSVRVVRL